MQQFRSKKDDIMINKAAPMLYSYLKHLKIDDGNQMIDVNIAMTQPGM